MTVLEGGFFSSLIFKTICILSQFDYYGEVSGQGGSKYVYSKILCSMIILAWLFWLMRFFMKF